MQNAKRKIQNGQFTVFIFVKPVCLLSFLFLSANNYIGYFLVSQQKLVLSAVL